MLEIFKKPLVFLTVLAFSLSCSSSHHEFDGEHTEMAIVEKLYPSDKHHI